MRTLYRPEDETVAFAIKAMLEANSIYPAMLSFHDTAYDGIYQGQHGWGVIKVDESDYKLAASLLADWETGTPDFEELREGSQEKEPERSAQQNRVPVHNLLLPSLLVFSILLNVLLCVLYVSSRKQGQQRRDGEQFDANGSLISRVEWGGNKNNPFKYTYYLRNGKISSISFDANDDGRTDKLIKYIPDGKEIYVNKDADGVYETCNIAFDSGSHVEYKDHDQNEVFESCVVTLSNGRGYKMTLSNSNGFVLMMTSPSGQPVSLDLLKQIACEL